MFVEKGGAVPWALNSKLVGYVLMPGLEGGAGACLALGFSMLQSERGGKSPQLFPLTDGLQRLFQLPAPAGTAASGPAVSASVQEAYAATLLSWRAGILKAAGGYNSLSALDELVPLVGHGGASLFKQKRWHEVACALNQLQMRVALGPPGALPPAGKFEAVKFWATRGTHASAAGAGACAAALAATAVQPARVGAAALLPMLAMQALPARLLPPFVSRRPLCFSALSPLFNRLPSPLRSERFSLDLCPHLRIQTCCSSNEPTLYYRHCFRWEECRAMEDSDRGLRCLGTWRPCQPAPAHQKLGTPKNPRSSFRTRLV